jgi:hypothetical protein
MIQFQIDDALLAGATTTGVVDDFACYRLAARLGGLACWLLRDEVLERAATYWEKTLGNANEASRLRTPPRLSRQPGVCGVLFAVESPTRFPLLRDAFALPVRWVRVDGPAAGMDLPPGLATEALAVVGLLNAVQDRGEPIAGRWRLRLAADDCADKYNLSGWHSAGGGSAWGILMAALMTAQYEVETNLTVWASVGWDADHRRLKPVVGLKAKVAAARHAGAVQLFVAPDQDLPQVDGIDIRRLNEKSLNPVAALVPLQVAHALRPRPLADYLAGFPDDPGEARRRFFADANAYHRLLTDRGERDRASAYYRQELLGPIATRCRAQLSTDWPDRPRLVTFLSGTSELVELAVRIHRPSRVLILCTSETEVQQDRAAERVAEAAGTESVVEFRKISSDTLPGTLPSAVVGFARDGRAEDLVLDLTPGTKAITLTLFTDLAVSGSHPVYVHTSRPDGSTIQFGTEELVFLPTPAQKS